jgi:dCTP deaminase
VSMDWNTLPAGTLVDQQISDLADEHLLITDGFERRCVRQACYELRASDVFWDVASKRENKRVEVDEEGFVIGPNQYVVAITMETIELPDDGLGRILTKGQLFSLGILAVNTYADPGFVGRLGITLFNGSHRYVRIRPGEAIAKIEFSRLSSAVEKAYSGQHGYETEIWPIPVHLLADETQLRREGRIGSDVDELARSYGPAIADLARQVRYYRWRAWVQLSIVALAFGVLFSLYGKLSLVVSAAIGAMTNVATQLAFIWAERRRRS